MERGLQRSNRLRKIAKSSDLMEIKLQYGKDKIIFNLYEELKIFESHLAGEIKEQPQLYAYLSVLHTKLTIHKEQMEAERDRIYSKLFNLYKASKASKHYQATQRQPSDDICENYAMTSDTYIKANENYLKAKHDMMVIGNAVNAFDRRGSLIQTISANKRKEV
jgi:hypothetical protein